MNRNPKTRANNGFTIIELIVVVTVIGLLVAIAVGAYNKGFHDAKVTKSLAFVNTLATAKALFVADPKTTPALISTFNNAPNGNFAMIAPKGVQPTDEADLLAKSAMPSTGNPCFLNKIWLLWILWLLCLTNVTGSGCKSD